MKNESEIIDDIYSVEWSRITLDQSYTRVTPAGKLVTPADHQLVN